MISSHQIGSLRYLSCVFFFITGGEGVGGWGGGGIFMPPVDSFEEELVEGFLDGHAPANVLHSEGPRFNPGSALYFVS